jgi:hypothetical protein
MNPDIDQYYHTQGVILRILEFIGVPAQLLSKLTVRFSSPLSDSEMLKEVLRAATTEYVSARG